MNQSLRRPLVSIIMPAYNAGTYVAEAIRSVLSQSYSNFELLIVNDGSEDHTETEIIQFDDPRIRYFRNGHAGVSAARNVGLKNMAGDFFCFIDADDSLPRDSVMARMDVFIANPEASFVDGKVVVYDADMNNKLSEYVPAFTGNPLKNLLRLNSTCFFGLTWMIKRDMTFNYRMNETLSHCEDLLFYLELAREKAFYSFTKSEILNYRRHSTSAMGNLQSLHRGYRQTFNIVRHWKENDWGSKMIYAMKVKKIMFLSYWSRRRYQRAFAALWA